MPAEPSAAPRSVSVHRIAGHSGRSIAGGSPYNPGQNTMRDASSSATPSHGGRRPRGASPSLEQRGVINTELRKAQRHPGEGFPERTGGRFDSPTASHRGSPHGFGTFSAPKMPTSNALQRMARQQVAQSRAPLRDHSSVAAEHNQDDQFGWMTEPKSVSPVRRRGNPSPQRPTGDPHHVIDMSEDGAPEAGPSRIRAPEPRRSSREKRLPAKLGDNIASAADSDDQSQAAAGKGDMDYRESGVRLAVGSTRKVSNTSHARDIGEGRSQVGAPSRPEQRKGKSKPESFIVPVGSANIRRASERQNGRVSSASTSPVKGALRPVSQWGVGVRSRGVLDDDEDQEPEEQLETRTRSRPASRKGKEKDEEGGDESTQDRIESPDSWDDLSSTRTPRTANHSRASPDPDMQLGRRLKPLEKANGKSTRPELSRAVSPSSADSSGVEWVDQSGSKNPARPTTKVTIKPRKAMQDKKGNVVRVHTAIGSR